MMDMMQIVREAMEAGKMITIREDEIVIVPWEGDEDPEEEEKEKPKEPEKKKGGAPNKVDRGKVKALHDAGWNTHDIAFEVGCSDQTVRNIIAE